MDWTDLAIKCGSQVSPTTIKEIIRVESAGNPNTIHVNGIKVQPSIPEMAEEAARIAKDWIARGFTVDIGAMQINSTHLKRLGMTVEQVLDPCANIRTGTEILSANYTEAAKIFGLGQRALQAALSAYNTGNFERGFANGYVARYYPSVTNPAETPKPPNPYTAETAIEWTNADNF